MDYKIITLGAYLMCASCLAGYFAQVVIKAKKVETVSRFHAVFFRITSYLNASIMVAAFLTSSLHQAKVVTVLPEGGRLLFSASLLLAFPLNSFARYFQPNE